MGLHGRHVVLRMYGGLGLRNLFGGSILPLVFGTCILTWGTIVVRRERSGL